MLWVMLLLFFAEPKRDAGAWLQLAQGYAKENRRELALSAAAKAESLAGNDSEVLQGLANFYATAIADFPKAARLGAKYAEHAPPGSQAWQKLAAFCLSTGQPESAIAAAQRGLATDDSAGIHNLLGNAYAQQKDWPHAAEQLRIALKLSPYEEQSHFALAQVYLQQQNFPQAAAVLEGARQVFDKSPQIELALGVAYYGERRFPLAVDQFLKTIRLDPDVPQPYVFLSRMMDHLADRLPEANTLFTRYHDHHPDNYLGYLLHAQVLVVQLPPDGFPAEAETAMQLLQKAALLNDGVPETHYYLALLLERKRQFPEAAKQFERSIQLNPNDSGAHFRLARVYDRLGRRDEAATQRALHEKLSK